MQYGDSVSGILSIGEWRLTIAKRPRKRSQSKIGNRIGFAVSYLADEMNFLQAAPTFALLNDCY